MYNQLDNQYCSLLSGPHWIIKVASFKIPLSFYSKLGRQYFANKLYLCPCAVEILKVVRVRGRQYFIFFSVLCKNRKIVRVRGRQYFATNYVFVCAR